MRPTTRYDRTTAARPRSTATLFRAVVSVALLLPAIAGAATAWAQAEAPVDAEEVETAAVEEQPAPVKRIKMTAENWKWTPNVIRVPVGTRVRIEFQSYDASHSFVLKDFRIKVALPEGSPGEVEFLADKVGQFRWKCGRPCGNGCAKMSGKLIVE